MSLVYGNFESIKDLNETAFNLRAAGAKEDLIMLGRENNIDIEKVTAYFESDVDNLIERCCRVCGCTEHNACEGGCSWVEDDLCSKCAVIPIKVDTANQSIETNVDNGCSGAKDKLLKELESDRSNLSKKVIVDYLIGIIHQDDEIGKLIVNSSKNLKGCMAFITVKAKSALSGSSGCVIDSTVFGWALEYYLGEDKKPVEQPKVEEKKSGLDEFTRNLINKAKANKDISSLSKADSKKQVKLKVVAPVKDQISFDFGGL